MMNYKEDFEKNFSEVYKNNIRYVENVFKHYVRYNYDFTKGLTDAYQYSLFGGGKRIRPIIMLETYKCFSNELKYIEPFFTALEMIHTYSLIHDDLPALDNDDLRRGRATLHKVSGEDIALLAGDTLLNKSFEIMSAESIRLKIFEKGMKAISIMSEKSGERGMIGGQYVDVLNDDNKVDEHTLNFINEHKTSALLEAAFMVGAVIGGASEEQVNNFERVGKKIGLAFQIQDDVLDVTSTTKELGKPVGSDKKNNKNTFVDIYGVDKAIKMYEDYYDEASFLLKQIVNNGTFLNYFVESIKNRVN